MGRIVVPLAEECGSAFSGLPCCLVCSANKWLLCPCLCDYGMQLGRQSLHTKGFCVTVYIYPWPPLQPSDLWGLKCYSSGRHCGLDTFFSLWPWFGKSLTPSGLAFVLGWQVFSSHSLPGSWPPSALDNYSGFVGGRAFYFLNFSEGETEVVIILCKWGHSGGK